MKRRKAILFGKITVALSVIPAMIYAFPDGPPAGVSGAPGEKTCWQSGCHQTSTGTLISPSDKVNIDFGGSATYTPGGSAQHWTLTADDPLAAVFGFQLSTRAESTNGQVGTFTPMPGDSIRVICADDTLRPSGGCPASASVEYIEHTAPRSPGSFSFDWTPPATDVGNVKVYVAVNAANGNFSNTGDRIHVASFTLTPDPAGAAPAVNQGGVVNAWSFAPVIADSAWVAIFGSNLAQNTRTWRDDEIINGKLPVELDDVKVRIGGEDAAVYFISPGQLNVQVPSDSITGPVPVEVTNKNGVSNTVMVNKQAISPALFSWAGVVSGGERFVGTVAARSDVEGEITFIGQPGLLQPIGISTRPAKPGETVLFFATGCGPTNPLVPAGQVVDVSQGLPVLANQVSITIGGIPAAIDGNTGFLIFAGECQFNLVVPGNAPDGDLPVVLDIGGNSTLQTQPDLNITVQR